MRSTTETKNQQLQAWFTSFAKEFNENEPLREKIHEQLFLYSVASQHQLKKDKLILANYFSEQIFELIQKDKRDNKLQKFKKLFQETLVNYMMENITDEKAHDYFYEYLATLTFLNLKQNYEKLISRVEESIRNASKYHQDNHKNRKNTDVADEIVRNFRSVIELTYQFVKGEETTAKLATETNNAAFFGIGLGAMCMVISRYIQFEDPNIYLHDDYTISKLTILDTFSVLLAALTSLTLTSRLTKKIFQLEHRTGENKPMKDVVFQVEKLSEFVPAGHQEYQPLEYNAGKPSDTSDKKADTSKQEEQRMEDPQNNSKTENNNNAGISNNNNSKSSKPYSKAKLFKPKDSKEEQEPVDLNTCTMAANNKTFALSADKVRPLIRGTRTAPPIDGKFVIYFDKTELGKIEHKKHNKVAKEAVFYPGAAEGKDCIHYLGNGIWSMKCSTNDIRVLGTVIGKDQNNKNLIYFWKLVDHKEQKRLLRDAAKLKAVLSTPPEIVYTAKEQARIGMK